MAQGGNLVPRGRDPFGQRRGSGPIFPAHDKRLGPLGTRQPRPQGLLAFQYGGTYPPTENDQYKHLSNVSEMIVLIILAIRIAAITQVSSPNSIIICY